MINSVISSIQAHCQLNSLLPAVQDAVRLARLKSDIPALAYFLFELSGPGNVRGTLKTEFPELKDEKETVVVSQALERYQSARQIRSEEAKVLGLQEGSVLAFSANEIDDQINQMSILLIEAKHKSNSVLSSSTDKNFWIKHMTAIEVKIRATKRIKSTILNACFNYSSQIERTEYASRSFSEELRKITDTISFFIREFNVEASAQFESILSDISEKSPERRTHLLTSVRRLIVSLADCLSPPQAVAGLSKDQPINRLQFFLEKNLDECGRTREKKALEAILRSVYDRANKGVHANASEMEVQQTVLQLLVYLNALQSVVQIKSREP